MGIDTVAAGAGVIGMMACPRGAADFAALAGWRPDAVVTLLPGEEMARLGVPDLGARVRASGAAWHHLPIADMRAPDAGFEAAWRTADLSGGVRAGARVLIHCRAGLGRTGTVAARLLIDLGLPPRHAISTIRAARPGTIETAGQVAYLHAMGGG